MNNTELKEIYGGVSWGVWSLIGSAVTFILGLLDGIINPMKCGQ